MGNNGNSTHVGRKRMRNSILTWNWAKAITEAFQSVKYVCVWVFTPEYVASVAATTIQQREVVEEEKKS